MKKIKGIEINPEIMFGKPVIAGTRIPVEIILEKLALGQTAKEILENYPRLNKENIKNAVNYANTLVKNVTPAQSNVRATLHKISR